MATGTSGSTAEFVRSTVGDWRLGLTGGLVGGFVAAAFTSFVDPETLRTTVPAVYGLAPPPDALLGWIVVLVHGSVLGVVFAALIERGELAGAAANEQLRAGLGFGLTLWLVLAVVGLPVWLRLTGSSVVVPLPYLSSSLLAAHLTYGFTLGIVYYMFDAAAEEPTEPPAGTD